MVRLTEQRNIWSPNFATITNSPVEYAFSGSEVCLPSAPFWDYGHLLHVTEEI